MKMFRIMDRIYRLYPNRTLFYDALLPMVGKDKLFDDLDNVLELVRDGQKSWESFVIFAKYIIQQIKEKYKDSEIYT